MKGCQISLSIIFQYKLISLLLLIYTAVCAFLSLMQKWMQYSSKSIFLFDYIVSNVNKKEDVLLLKSQEKYKEAFGSLDWTNP